MAIPSFMFDAQAGQTPGSIESRRKIAQTIAAGLFGRAPQNLGEGLNSIGDALLFAKMNNDASTAEKAGLGTVPQMFGGTGANPTSAAIASMITGQPAGVPSGAPAGPVVPNDDNAMPGTVGMNQALADRSQDFMQDFPNTSLSSGVRSTADQARLYADRANNSNPVARPGTSNHERGLAIDIGGMTPDQRAILPQYGLSQPVPRDPPHVELAPNTQYAQATPQTMNDGAELPANAQPTQGTLPTAQAVQAASAPKGFIYPGLSDDDLRKGLANKWVPKETRAIILKEMEMRAEAAQKAGDPLRKLDMRGKELANQKIERELQGEGATPLNDAERTAFNIPAGQPAYKTRAGDIKFGPAGTKITNNVGADETAFDKEAGKVQAQRFNDLIGEGQQAKQMVADISTLTDLGKSIGTGKGAQVRAALGPFAEAVGAKIEGLSDIQAFNSIVNRMAPALRVKGSGSQSDTELKNFLMSLPSLGNTPEGNEIIGTVMTGLQQNKIAAAEIGSKALNKEITRSEAEKQLRNLPDPMQPYRDYKASRSKVDSLLQKYGPK